MMIPTSAFLINNGQAIMIIIQSNHNNFPNLLYKICRMVGMKKENKKMLNKKIGMGHGS